MNTEQKIDQIGVKLDNLTSVIEKHVAYDEGLELPERVKSIETKIKTKVSWMGLSGALGTLSLVLGMIFTIVKGV